MSRKVTKIFFLNRVRVDYTHIPRYLRTWLVRLCARLWLSSKCPQTAYRPTMMVHINFYTSIFISLWDKLHTLSLSFFLSVFSLFFVLASFTSSKTKNLFQKNHEKRQKQNRGAAPRTFCLRGCAPPQVGAKCLVEVVLDNHNRAHSRSKSTVHRGSAVRFVSGFFSLTCYRALSFIFFKRQRAYDKTATKRGKYWLW